jgi:adenylylsulfate kinase-like enzyme
MIPVLWVTGPPGVGKTAVAWEIYRRLRSEDADAAYVDVDQLGMCLPPFDADPEGHSLKARNVAALRRNFGNSGARMLIVSGVVDAQRGPELDGLGGPRVGVARLRTDPDELRARLRRRNGRLRPQRGSREQHDSAVDVAEALDQSTFADWCIDTTGSSIDEVAAAALDKIRDWPAAETRSDVGTAERAESTHVGGEMLCLAGPTGVGKSTIGYRAYLDVLRSGRPAAFIDVDQLGFFGATPGDQPLRVQNLAAVWRNFNEVDARLGVAVGSVSTAAERHLYEQALANTTISWCQLRLGAPELTRRVLSRGEGGSWAQPGDPLLGKPEVELLAVAARALEVSTLLDQHPIGVRVDVDGLDADDAATKLLALARWPTS